MTELSPPAVAADALRPPFFIQARPIWHYVVLSLATFGLYLVFWYWRTWRYFRVVQGMRIIPLARAVLDVFFAYSLFRHLGELARKRGYPESPPAGPLALLYVLFSLCRALPLPAGVAGFLIFAPLLPAFEMANYIWRSEWPEIPERRGFSLPEALLVGFGVFLWTNVIYLAVFHPELLSPPPGAAPR